jgi:hypothetical protein
MFKKLFFTFTFTVLISITNAYSQITSRTNCAGEFKTFTIGGWGTNCNGNNPGCFRDANFASTFPNGVSIGCGTNKLNFSSSAAIDAFLPSGGPASVLSGTINNPTSGNPANVLASQVLALTLNVQFDATIANFAPSASTLGSLTIISGTFAGMTVSNFLQIANDVLGGCSNAYSLGDINSAATAINENFNDGIDKGFLNCNTPRLLNINVRVGFDPEVCNSDKNLVTLTISGGTPGYTVQLFNSNNTLINTINTNDTTIYLNTLAPGNYSVIVTDTNSNSATLSW